MYVKTKLILGLVAALLVAACEDSDNDTASGAEQLGNEFATMFAADPMSDPVDAQTVDILPVSNTTDPFNP